MQKIAKIELIGTVVCLFAGFFLHFAYQLSGNIKLVAIIAAVNESTWEHIKLGFWPLLFLSIYEYFVFGKKLKNFFVVKALVLLSFIFLIPFIFYTYKFILGRNFLILDILTFIVSLILSQWLGFKILISKKLSQLNNMGSYLIVFMMIIFIIFTFCPPKIFLFKDPLSGEYGVGNLFKQNQF